MKPYTMATALEQTITPDTVLPATSAWKVPGCRVTKTQDCVVHGEPASTMAPPSPSRATRTSPSWRTTSVRTTVAKMANRLGVSSLDPTRTDYNTGITLGVEPVSPLDMAVAYSTFENHGVKNDPTPVIKMTDPQGTVLADNTGRAGTPVLNPAIADTVTDLLRGPVTNGTASKTLSGFGRPAASKTGTTAPQQRRRLVRRLHAAADHRGVDRPHGRHPHAEGLRYRPGVRRHGAGPDLEGVHDAGPRRQPSLGPRPRTVAPARHGLRRCRHPARRPSAQRALGTGSAHRLRRPVHRDHPADLAATPPPRRHPPRPSHD
jgi:hypothetical protein